MGFWSKYFVHSGLIMIEKYLVLVKSTEVLNKQCSCAEKGWPACKVVSQYP